MNHILLLITLATLMMLPSFSYSSKRESVANNIIRKHSLLQKKENQLTLIGSGTAMPDKLHAFILHYVSNQQSDIPSARKIAISCVDSLLELINSNSQLKEELVKYPFDAENVKIFIRFESPAGVSYESPKVALVNIHDGKISYSYYDNKSGQYLHDKSVNESYDQAKGKVAQ